MCKNTSAHRQRIGKFETKTGQFKVFILKTTTYISSGYESLKIDL